MCSVNVVVPVTEGLDRALKLLRKLKVKDGVDRDVRRHDHYVKPSLRRKMKSALARKRLRKEEKRRLGKAA